MKFKFKGKNGEPDEEIVMTLHLINADNELKTAYSYGMIVMLGWCAAFVLMYAAMDFVGLL